MRLLRRAELYDLLTWQQERLRAALRDASASEAEFLVDAASAYGRAAEGIPRQPPVAAWQRPKIQISGPARVDLIDTSEREVALRVANKDQRPVDVWLVADYDPAMLGLSAGLQRGLYDAAEFPVSAIESLAAGSGSPSSTQPRPGDLADLTRFAPTYRLRPDETQTLRIRVQRKSFSESGARIALRAVTAAGVVRHDLAADLPSTSGVDLVVDGLAETWQRSDDGLTLYPFPNTTTSYKLYLANSDAQEKLVDVLILRLAEGRLAFTAARRGRRCRRRRVRVTRRGDRSRDTRRGARRSCRRQTRPRSDRGRRGSVARRLAPAGATAAHRPSLPRRLANRRHRNRRPAVLPMPNRPAARRGLASRLGFPPRHHPCWGHTSIPSAGNGRKPVLFQWQPPARPAPANDGSYSSRPPGSRRCWRQTRRPRQRARGHRQTVRAGTPRANRRRKEPNPRRQFPMCSWQ